MSRSNSSPVIPLAISVCIGVAAAPVHGQETEVRGAPPAGAVVHEFQTDNWRDPLCAGSTEWTFEVPRGAWIEFPAAWVAVDEATARANWEHMRYEIAIDGSVLDNPEDVEWQVEAVRFACPDRVVEGVAVAPVLYFSPVADVRTFRLRMLFDADVNDGWSVYPKGTDAVITVTHKPAG